MPVWYEQVAGKGEWCGVRPHEDNVAIMKELHEKGAMYVPVQFKLETDVPQPNDQRQFYHASEVLDYSRLHAVQEKVSLIHDFSVQTHNLLQLTTSLEDIIPTKATLAYVEGLVANSWGSMHEMPLLEATESEDRVIPVAEATRDDLSSNVQRTTLFNGLFNGLPSMMKDVNLDEMKEMSADQISDTVLTCYTSGMHKLSLQCLANPTEFRQSLRCRGIPLCSNNGLSVSMVGDNFACVTMKYDTNFDAMFLGLKPFVRDAIQNLSKLSTNSLELLINRGFRGVMVEPGSVGIILYFELFHAALLFVEGFCKQSGIPMPQWLHDVIGAAGVGASAAFVTVLVMLIAAGGAGVTMGMAWVPASVGVVMFGLTMLLKEVFTGAKH